MKKKSRNNEKLLISSSVYLMHAVEGHQKKCDTENWPWMYGDFYKGILNKTYLYILINSLVWREICSFSEMKFSL